MSEAPPWASDTPHEQKIHPSRPLGAVARGSKSHDGCRAQPPGARERIDGLFRLLHLGGLGLRLAARLAHVKRLDAIELRALVVRRREVRVAFDDEQPTLGIEVAGDRMDDVGRRGKQLNDEPRIAFAFRLATGRQPTRTRGEPDSGSTMRMNCVGRKTRPCSSKRGAKSITRKRPSPVSNVVSSTFVPGR